MGFTSYQFRPPRKLHYFLEKCQQYINSTVEIAVDERRHDTVKGDEIVSHLAQALSARDLHEQVTSLCPPGTPIPSIQWLRYQFWPRKQFAATSERYTGRLKIKFMVQSRQFRHNHVDSHYASALYRYGREFAIQYRHFTTFICQDDKHTIKIGEPNYPVAAVDRGKQVLVGLNKKLVVGDHDFTKLKLTPSVNFLVEIPESIEGTFYHGKVYVGLKDSTFQPSSPMRHASELVKTLRSVGHTNPILLLYTDGGPDHRSTNPTVKIALICLFLHLDLDFICAIRTPPYNSWKNPAERIMSILNLALQGAGIARNATSYEDRLKACSSMKQIRELAEKIPDVKAAVLDSVEDSKILLYSLFDRLKLKGEPFNHFCPASDIEIQSLWEEIKKVDDTMTVLDTTTKALLSRRKLQDFIQSHCNSRHYMFSVKKCFQPSCTVCKPPRLPADVVHSLHHIPDPVPLGEHYRNFTDLYGTDTTEQYRPSLTKNSTKSHGMPFSPTAQYAKNVGTVMQCCECSKWRLLYSKSVVKRNQKTELEILLEDIHYVCGNTLTEIDCDNAILDGIYARINLSCTTPIEIPYYSAGNDPICYFCGTEDGLRDQCDTYPICILCFAEAKRPPLNRKRPFKPKN